MKITIRNEAEAWELLNKTLNKSLPSEHFTIHFEGWPKFHIKLEGPGYDSTITTGMMASFLDLQRNIYQTYAKIKYDQSKARLLSKEERNSLELIVQVKPGSSEITALFEKISEKLIETSLPSMTNTQFLILALSAILVYGGTTMFKAYLENQKEVKGIDLQKFLSEQETNRLEIFQKAIAQNSYARSIKSEGEEVYNKFLKSSSHADSVTIAESTIQKEGVIQLVRGIRSRSSETRLDGMYRIRKVDSSKANFFKVDVMDDSGKIFSAVLEDHILTSRERNKELILDAEWSRKQIYLIIVGKEVRGEITHAKIIDVRARYLAEEIVG